MIEKFKLYIMAGALVLATGFGAWASHRFSAARVQAAETAAAAFKAEAKGLRTQLEAERLAGAVRASVRASVARQTKENHVNLETALGASPAWRDEPVPAAVVDSLRDAARRANAAAP